jgi:hypothetical protein
VPVVARAAGLGAAGPAVAEALAELQDQLSLCFDEATQSRFGRVPVSRSLDARADEPEGPVLLTLHIEMRPGEVRIVDAPVEVQGTASDGLVACAQQVLRNRAIPTPGLKARTGRARVVFPLVP